jgi:hypothetical protein
LREQGRSPAIAPYLQAQCWRAADRPDLAQREIERALQADGNYQPALKLAGNLALDNEEWDRAVRYAVALEKLSANSPDPLLWRLAALPQLGRSAEAQTVGKELIARFPARLEGYLGMARLLEHASDFPAALSWLDRWRSQGRADPDSLRAEVRLLVLARRTAEAESVASTGKDSGMALAAARGFLDAGAFGQAEGEARRALKLAEILPQAQRQAEAIRAELFLGELYLAQCPRAETPAQRREAVARALAAYQSAYEKAPGHRVAGNHLARLLDTERGEAEAALAILQQVRLGRCSRKPCSGDRLPLELLDTIGLVYCDAKHYKEGVVVFTEAARRYTNEPLVLLYRGRCHAGLHQDLIARDELNRAQSLARERADKDPDPQRRARWLALAEDAQRDGEKLKGP